MAQSLETLEHSQAVSFNLGSEIYGIPISHIQEIIRMTEIVKIPKSPEFVEGIINLRGKVLPIIDLRERFSLSAIDRNQNVRIIVVEMAELMAGLIVDEVHQVFDLDNSHFEAAPELVTNENQRFLAGIVKKEEQMILLLDVGKLLSQQEHEILKQAQV